MNEHSNNNNTKPKDLIDESVIMMDYERLQIIRKTTTTKPDRSLSRIGNTPSLRSRQSKFNDFHIIHHISASSHEQRWWHKTFHEIKIINYTRKKIVPSTCACEWKITFHKRSSWQCNHHFCDSANEDFNSSWSLCGVRYFVFLHSINRWLYVLEVVKKM